MAFWSGIQCLTIIGLLKYSLISQGKYQTTGKRRKVPRFSSDNNKRYSFVRFTVEVICTRRRYVLMKAEIGSSDHRHEALLATSTPSALGKKVFDNAV